MKKNGILTFLFAFVPGAGQMYQGYMKRGLSLITLFFLCIMAGMLLLEPLVLTALIVWMYSFFDTFNLRAQFIAGTAPADDYLVHFNTKDARLTLFFRDSHKLVGWALIALGAMVAYQNIIMRVSSSAPSVSSTRCSGSRPGGAPSSASTSSPGVFTRRTHALRK